MLVRTFVLFVALTQLSACVVIPKIKMAESYNFDFEAPSQAPVGYADLLCCFDCTV